MDNIHDIRSICGHSTHIDKLSMENTKFRIINQHKNAMCHIQSLENDFYLNALGSFDHVFTQICTNYFLICSMKHQQIA
jgi:hypothetical protein